MSLLRASCLSLLLLAAPVLGADPAPVPPTPLSIGGDLVAKQGKPPVVKLKAIGVPDKAAILWRYDKKNLAGIKAADGTFCLVGAPGTYTVELLAVGVKDGAAILDETQADITIEGSGPGPGPGPGPAPGPDVALLKAIQDAYTADTSPAKADQLKQLASLYRQASILLSQEGVKTLADLKGALAAARKSLIPDEALVGVRKAITPELATLGTDPAAVLDAALKARARAEFARITAALEGVK